MLTLEQARKLRDGITPGPWAAEYTGWEFYDIRGPENSDGWKTVVAEYASPANARAIAALPDLLDLVDAQAAEIAALEVQPATVSPEVAALVEIGDKMADCFNRHYIVPGLAGRWAKARAALAATEPRHG